MTTQYAITTQKLNTDMYETITTNIESDAVHSHIQKAQVIIILSRPSSFTEKNPNITPIDSIELFNDQALLKLDSLFEQWGRAMTEAAERINAFLLGLQARHSLQQLQKSKPKQQWGHPKIDVAELMRKVYLGSHAQYSLKQSLKQLEDYESAYQKANEDAFSEKMTHLANHIKEKLQSSEKVWIVLNDTEKRLPETTAQLMSAVDCLYHSLEKEDTPSLILKDFNYKLSLCLFPKSTTPLPQQIRSDSSWTDQSFYEAGKNMQLLIKQILDRTDRSEAAC